MRWVIYQGVDSQWRWRLVSRNGRILADSGEGYTRRQHAERAVQVIRSAAVRGALQTARVVAA